MNSEEADNIEEVGITEGILIEQTNRSRVIRKLKTF